MKEQYGKREGKKMKKELYPKETDLGGTRGKQECQNKENKEFLSTISRFLPYIKNLVT